MNAVVAILPTDAAIEAAWERYTAIARRVADQPMLLVDRDHCEEFAIAWEAWRDLFLSRRRM
jgi:hypothetical protein